MSNCLSLKVILSSVVLFFIATIPLMAQELTLQGTVLDSASNTPLQGAVVTLVGSDKKEAITGASGKFSLLRSSGDVLLEVSYVGYVKQSLPLSNSNNLIIYLAPVIESDLNDVVVIGYGKIKRKDLTGSIATAKAADIVRSPTSNPFEAIQGMVPGMEITKTSGNAGAGLDIQIRGTRTINGSSSPLVIIDGAQGGDLSTLNPNDIASVDVLKDASSTAIYGSQGANGVIMVTTKQGAAGKIKVSYNNYFGIDGFTEYPTPRTGDSYLNLRREAYKTIGEWSSLEDDANIFSTDELNAIKKSEWINWIDLLKQNGMKQNHSLSLSGGTDKTKVYFSAGYYQDEGMVKFNNQKQYNALLNIDQKINSWAKAGMQAAFIHSTINNRGSDPFSTAMTTVPLGQPYDSAGNINIYPLNGNEGILSPLTDDRGPQIATNNTEMNRTTINGHIEINPIRNLTFKTLFGANFSNSRNGEYYDATSRMQVNSRYSAASITMDNSKFYNWDNILTYSKDFGDHSLTVTGLTSFTKSIDESLYAYGTDLVYSSQLFYNLAGTSATGRQIASSYIGTSTMSYAGRINYSYKDKYLLTVTDRLDGASRLSEGHKWTSFPSVAAAWRLSNEDFIKNSMPAISDLKLRVSYGVAGNSGIDPYGTQSILINQSMGFENIPAPAYVFNKTIGNKNLGWELSKTTNIGIDLGLFKNRITLTADVYNTNTSDILLLRTLPPHLGVESTYQNVGATQNKGVEISLNTRNIDNADFKWLSTINFTSNRERITELIDGKDIFSSNGETGSLLLGHPVESFYNYEKTGIWQTSEADQAAQLVFGSTPFAPGDLKLVDINHDGKISPDQDRVYIGSAVPKWSGSLQNTFIYKGIDLTIYMIARYGQMIKDDVLGRFNPAGQGNNGPDYFDYWTPENPSNDYPRPRANTSLSSLPGATTLQFVDGSYWKIKTISLGYTFPQKVLRKLFVDNFRIYATCNNIFVHSRNKLIRYYDPERGGSEDSPLTRQLVFGLNIGF